MKNTICLWLETVEFPGKACDASIGQCHASPWLAQLIPSGEKRCMIGWQQIYWSIHLLIYIPPQKAILHRELLHTHEPKRRNLKKQFVGTIFSTNGARLPFHKWLPKPQIADTFESFVLMHGFFIDWSICLREEMICFIFCETSIQSNPKHWLQHLPIKTVAHSLP